ncbi:hypothetical protein BC628DRAFT_624144 [Trametes gibbosa]|nr:hypothetical protein BC628DRAFT_624144 [Trametes gibbosa]
MHLAFSRCAGICGVAPATIYLGLPFHNLRRPAVSLAAATVLKSTTSKYAIFPCSTPRGLLSIASDDTRIILWSGSLHAGHSTVFQSHFRAPLDRVLLHASLAICVGRCIVLICSAVQVERGCVMVLRGDIQDLNLSRAARRQPQFHGSTQNTAQFSCRANKWHTLLQELPWPPYNGIWMDRRPSPLPHIRPPLRQNTMPRLCGPQ